MAQQQVSLAGLRALPAEGDGHGERDAWLDAVGAGPLSPRLERALRLLRGEDPEPSRAWTRVCALFAIERPARVQEAPRLQGVLGGLLEGVATARRGQLLDGAEILGEVIGQARIEADEPVLTWALCERGRACGMSGDVAESARALTEAITLAARNEMPVAGCMAHTGLGMLYAQEGRSHDYERHTRKGIAIARDAGDVQGESHSLCNLGGALTTQRRFGEAEAAYVEAQRLAARNGLVRVQALALAGRGGLLIAQGDAPEGLPLYDAAQGLIEPLGDHFQVAYNDLMAARLVLASGDCAAALRRIDAAAHRSAAHGLSELEVRASELRSESLERMGRLQEALEASRESLRRERGRLDARVAASARAGERSMKTLLALKRAAWERRRRAELEETDRELRAALAEEARLRALLEQTARTDALTGIANRRAHEADVRAILADAARAGRPVAMFIIDIDHFKSINDTYGHDVGDEVIVGVARRLVEAVRAADRVARWGGEEFTLCAPGVDGAAAPRLAGNLLRNIRRRPFDTQVGPLDVTVSIGGAVHPPGAPDPERTLRLADAALYRAKREGRDRWVVARDADT